MGEGTAANTIEPTKGTSTTKAAQRSVDALVESVDAVVSVCVSVCKLSGVVDVDGIHELDPIHQIDYKHDTIAFASFSAVWASVST